MKTGHLIELVLLVALSFGAFALIERHAQHAVYVVVDIEEVTDPDANGGNANRSAASAATLLGDYDGVFLVRTEHITALDGPAPKRVIIARFNSTQEATAWYNSPEVRKINAIRFSNTKSRLFMVEGE
jgi:uncharacterized protein (DUF1330 family)